MSFREECHSSSSAAVRPSRVMHPSSLLTSLFISLRDSRLNAYMSDGYNITTSTPLTVFATNQNIDDDEADEARDTRTPPPAPRPNTYAFEMTHPSSILSPSTGLQTPLPSPSHSPVQSKSQFSPSFGSIYDFEVDMSSLIMDTDISSTHEDSSSFPSTPPVAYRDLRVVKERHTRARVLGLGIEMDGLSFGLNSVLADEVEQSGEDLASERLADEDDDHCRYTRPDYFLSFDAPAIFSNNFTHTCPSSTSGSMSDTMVMDEIVSQLDYLSLDSTAATTYRKPKRNISLATISSQLKCVPKKNHKLISAGSGNTKGTRRWWKL